MCVCSFNLIILYLYGLSDFHILWLELVVFAKLTKHRYDLRNTRHPIASPRKIKDD